MFGCSITAEKLRAVAGERSLASGQIRKRDAAAELSVPRAAREYGA